MLSSYREMPVRKWRRIRRLVAILKAAPASVKIHIFIIFIMTSTCSHSAELKILLAGGSLPSDPPLLAKMSNDSLDMMERALRDMCPASSTERLAGSDLSVESFRSALENLISTCSPEDTVIVYTHTHGKKASGLVVGLTSDLRSPGPTLGWDEYAKLLVSIPAKNVIVFTMSCFSGKLAESLEKPPIKHQWESRMSEGRGFLVVTSQDGNSRSTPIALRDGMVNPFAAAIRETLSTANPDATDIHFIAEQLPHYTRALKSISPHRPNRSNPIAIGSYPRSARICPR
jgi:hypothetical protein